MCDVRLYVSTLTCVCDVTLYVSTLTRVCDVSGDSVLNRLLSLSGSHSVLLNIESD